MFETLLTKVENVDTDKNEFQQSDKSLCIWHDMDFSDHQDSDAVNRTDVFFSWIAYHKL